MKQYIADVVGRYKDSPAIFAWEMGNEYSLGYDLPYDHSGPFPAGWLPPTHTSLGCPATRDPYHDFWNHDIAIFAFKAFATEVRKYDPYRLLITGNSAPRGSAWHSTNDNSWQTDTRAQFGEILLRDNPDPINTIGVHIYSMTADLERFFADGRVTNDGLIKEIKDIGASVNKPVFIGEFCSPSLIDNQPNPNERAENEALLASIEKYEIPLSALWTFDMSSGENPVNTNTTPDNKRAYLLDLIRAANDRSLPANYWPTVPVELSAFSVE